MLKSREKETAKNVKRETYGEEIKEGRPNLLNIAHKPTQ